MRRGTATTPHFPALFVSSSASYTGLERCSSEQISFFHASSYVDASYSIRIRWKSSRHKNAVLSPEQLERRFREAENTRTEAYEETRRQQQLDFSLAVSPWTQAEDARNEEFQKFLIEAFEAFMKHQERRSVELKEVIDRHDAVFRVNDTKRQAAFNEANDSQLKIFQVTQEKTVLDPSREEADQNRQ